MKLNIEVESEAFEKTIKDGMEALSKEELGSIIKQAIIEAFSKCTDFRDMLVKYDRGWNGNERATLGPLAEEAIKSIDMQNDLSLFKSKMTRALIENHREIVEDMILRCLIDKIVYDNHFQSSIEGSIRMIMTREANRGQPY